MKYFAIIVLSFTGSVVSAQSVSPVIQEARQGKNGVEGTFTLANSQIYPMAINSIVAQSFTVDSEGKMTMRDLDPDIHVRLSETSSRIPAQQSRTIAFQASCDRAPCWFIVFSSFQMAKNAQGVVMRIQLPEVIYITDRDVPKDSLSIRLTGNGAELVNDSDQYIRALKVEAVVNGKRVQDSGFPCFPHSKRVITLAGKPDKVEVVFPRFKVSS